jgi:hypothetical protein
MNCPEEFPELIFRASEKQEYKKMETFYKIQITDGEKNVKKK